MQLSETIQSQNTPFSYQNKRVLVVGLKRSGVAAALLLLKLHAIPVLNDMKKREDLQDAGLETLDAYEQIEWRLGENAIDVLKSCDAMVISPAVDIASALVKEAQKLNKYVVGELEFAYQNLQGTVLAVTGTNGKTTTVSLLREIFNAAGKKTYLGGNIGYPLSMIALESKKEDMVVVEVSSFQLESMHTFAPRAAAVLNITEDHLVRHKTMQRYIELKKSIFDRQNNEDYAVLNYEDQECRKMEQGIPSKVLYFSSKNILPQGAYVQDGYVVVSLNGEQKQIIKTEEIAIKGAHNLENALAATLLSYAMHVPAPVIRHALKAFKGVEHRIEKVRVLNDITYYNDSKGTNVDSTIKAIQTMDENTVIILGGYDKNISFEQLAECMKQAPFIQHAVLLGQTKNQIQKELMEKGYQNIAMVDTLLQAVEKATSLCKGKSSVLFSPACASFDMFNDYEERGRIFKEMVHQLK